MTTRPLRRQLLPFLPIFAMLLGCSGAPGTDPASAEAAFVEPGPACEVDSPRSSPLELFVQPEVGTAPFASLIARATTSVDVMVYQMGFGPILEGLEAKARAGIRVRVILDRAQENVNRRYKERLEAAGATVIWSDPRFVFMHAKVIMVDGREAILGTGNYSESYMLRERNFAVRDTDPQDLAALRGIFEADFSGTEPDLSCTRLLVAPVNARARLLALIGSATKSLTVHSMQLGDRDVRDAIAARKAAGVDVRVLLADPGWIDANAAAGTFLAEHAIPARWKKSLHVKALLVDGKAAYIGSINLSWNSITKNREVGVVMTEPEGIAAVRATFESDWEAATPFGAP
jgi:phosphatidylserine/phosphatidylglycerophosphate/cardiolipin synthase-like enzyme